MRKFNLSFPSCLFALSTVTAPASGPIAAKPLYPHSVFADAAPSFTTPAQPTMPPRPAVDGATGRVYTVQSDGTVLAAGAARPSTAIPVPGGAVGVVLNPATNLVYIVGATGTLNVVDGITDTLVSSVEVGRVGTAIGINTITNRVYVATDSGLAVFDAFRNAVVGRLPAVFASADVVVNEATNRLYASSPGEDCVHAVDGFSNVIVASVRVGDWPLGLAVNPVTNKIYVANAGVPPASLDGDSVSVIDGAANVVDATIPLGRQDAVALSFDPSLRLLTVTMSDGETIEVDSATNTIASSGQPAAPPSSSIQANASAIRTLDAASPAAVPAVTTPGAAIYNVRLVTDASPDLTDLNSLVNSATSLWATPREKVWALFYWGHILKRQTSPIVRHGFEVTDPIRNLVDFGYTMCSTISGINQSLYEALGLQHQYWDICNHTVSAVNYDGAFHMVDTSMSNLVTKDDGVTLAGVEEAAAGSARLVRERSLYATGPNGFLTGSDTMRDTVDLVSPVDGSIVGGYYRTFCESNLRLRNYFYNWNSGHRYILNLRQHESYTRFFAPLGISPDYWVSSERVAAPDPANTFQNDAANRFGLRGSGIWTFTPDLAGGGWALDTYRSTNVSAAAGGLSADVAGQPSEVIYKLQAANAIASQSIKAQFARPDALAAADISISLNHGATWVDVGTLGTTVGSLVLVSADLRDQVNGAYETLVRIRMTTHPATPAGVVLTGLTITTRTQVNAKALPRLNIGRNVVHVGAADQSDSMVLWPDLRGDLWRNDTYASQNIASQPVTLPRTYTSVVYPAVLSQDAYLIYRMAAPADLTRIVYGGRLFNADAGSYIDFLHSFDGGATWIRSYRLSDVTLPHDVIHYETITNIPPGARTVLFKYLIHNTGATVGRAAGLYAVRMEANHRPAVDAPAPLDVVFRWRELRPDRSTVARSHKQRVSEFPSTYVINVGGSDHPIMDSVTVNVAAAGDAAPFGYGDGIDAGGQKYVHTHSIDGTNFGLGKPYTFSRPPSGFQYSAGASNTTILTDGIAGSPVTGSYSYWLGQCWTSGTPVDLQVDLQSIHPTAVVRAHLFGYPGWDALKGQVQDQVEVLTSADGASYVSRGFLQTSLWYKDIPINYMLQDDERATAWDFALTIEPPVPARFVKYRVTPKRTLCLSELQVLQGVTRTPFDIRIALPSSQNGQPNTVLVPDVTGKTRDVAIATLNASGLTVGPVTEVVDSAVPAGVVISHTPSAGASVAPGTAVALTVSIGPGRSVPPPWTSRDVGAVGLAGSSSFDQVTGTFTIAGAGADIWGTADAFHSVFRSLNGDGEIAARVASVQNTNAWVKAGVMIRADTTPGSAHAMMIVTPGKGNNFQRRAVAGGTSSSTAGSFVTAPQWVKLARAGNIVTAYESSDGANWIKVGAEAIALPPQALVGLVLSSHSAVTLATAAFDAVTVANSLMSPWTGRDIGAVGLAGSASLDQLTGTHTLTGAGADIWGSADAFHYEYQPLKGDGEIVARVAAVQNTNAWVKAGVMIRADTTPGSAHAMMIVTPGKGNNFQRRTVAGGTSSSTPASFVTAPYWVKLTRSGDILTAYESPDGVNWVKVGGQAISMPSEVLAGLVVSSHSVTTLATATFDRVSISSWPALPSPWSSADVGAVPMAGSVAFDAGAATYSVTGSGADIWGAVDAFRYVYRPLAGDGEIVARVVSVESVTDWVKAGVMIRADLSPGSAHGMMMVTPAKGNNFQRRRVAGGTSTSTPGAFVAAPFWVKLTRTGDTIDAFESADGVTWTQVGSETIVMPGTVLVGLAVTSHSTSSPATALFDAVAVR